MMALCCVVAGCGFGLVPFGALVLYLAMRCRNCGRLPIASRADSGWPDFSVGVCPHCGAPR